MPLLRALADWQNRDHEGYVSRGDEFEASELRALDLVTGGLAVYAVSETSKIKVPSDPPDQPYDPSVKLPDHPAPASPRRPSRKR